VIQASVAAMRARIGNPQARIHAWLGPAIGPGRFEVGADVLGAMRATLPRARDAFAPIAGGKFLADLPALARQALEQVGVVGAGGGTLCTCSDPARFYSFRRDRITGRHAAVIWLAQSAASPDAPV
jgi:copper oxidase (laccase) domain-containing protein